MRRFLLAAAIIIGLASIPLLTSADQSKDNFQLEGYGLEGSRIFTVSPILPPGVPPVTLQAYVTYSAGGPSIGSDRTKPFASPQHGTWVHVHGHEYAGTFLQDLFDPAGTFVGTFKVRSRLQLVGKDEFVGAANVEQRDPGGNLQYSRCARFRGARVVVEPFESPCVGLEPGM